MPEKRKRETTLTLHVDTPNAPELTESDIMQYTHTLVSHKDKVGYCRERLTKHLPSQIPPLVDDILSYAYPPWRALLNPPKRSNQRQIEKTEKKGGFRLSLLDDAFNGFTCETSLLDGPKKWSCNIVTARCGWLGHNYPTCVGNYVAVGICNQNNTKAHVISLFDINRVSLTIEVFPDKIQFRSKDWVVSEIPISKLTAETEVLKLAAGPEVLKLAAGPEVPKLSEWYPYVCLRGDSISDISSLSVDVQDES